MLVIRHIVQPYFLHEKSTNLKASLQKFSNKNEPTYKKLANIRLLHWKTGREKDRERFWFS